MSFRSCTAFTLSLTILALLLSIHGGCQATCTSSSDCASTEFCSLTSGACLTSKSLGFCKARPTSCSDVLKPVCGCDGVSYGNACDATKHGVAVAGDGACGQGCGGVNNIPCAAGEVCELAVGACAQPNPSGMCKASPASCPATYSPVCGCDNKAYDNACKAALAAVPTLNTGDCSCGGETNVACEPGRYCQSPTGACVGVPGSCKPPPASCVAVSNPVCGCDGKTYDNACEAAKAEISLFATGECSCGGPPNIPCEPGRYCQLPTGACLGPNAAGQCKTVPPSCTVAKSPVCGCDGNTYDNACGAAKAKVSVATLQACSKPDGGVDDGGDASD